jgi:NADP-dependent 3-hydroxy acid dehydrogenase YdfG
MQLSTGSVVVITGAASGIGEGLARECVNRGYSAALADIEGPALQELEADRLSSTSLKQYMTNWA